MIYVVSGMFRSGTSMMMQALEAGGIPLYFNRARNALNEAQTNAVRRPNPNGLYEPSMDDMAEMGFPRQHDGKAIKVLIPWMHRLAVAAYRVIVMERDPEEILTSYETTFSDYWDGATRRKWIDNYPGAIKNAVEQFCNRNDVLDVNIVSLAGILKDPERILGGLHWPLEVGPAAALIRLPEAERASGR